MHGTVEAYKAVLPDQREVLDYWASLRAAADLPSWQAFRPASIVRRLPMISLLEVRTDSRFRFRLAGTGLRDVYGEELTGRHLCDIADGDQLAYWNDILGRLAETGQPATGAVTLRWREKPLFTQEWLRLPFRGRDGRIDMILGYDRFTMSQTSGLGFVPAMAEVNSLGTGVPIAA